MDRRVLSKARTHTHTHTHAHAHAHAHDIIRHSQLSKTDILTCWFSYVWSMSSHPKRLTLFLDPIRRNSAFRGVSFLRVSFLAGLKGNPRENGCASFGGPKTYSLPEFTDFSHFSGLDHFIAIQTVWLPFFGPSRSQVRGGRFRSPSHKACPRIH